MGLKKLPIYLYIQDTEGETMMIGSVQAFTPSVRSLTSSQTQPSTQALQQGDSVTISLAGQIIAKGQAMPMSTSSSTSTQSQSAIDDQIEQLEEKIAKLTEEIALLTNRRDRFSQDLLESKQAQLLTFNAQLMALYDMKSQQKS